MFPSTGSMRNTGRGLFWIIYFVLFIYLLIRYHMYGSDLGALGIYMGELTVNGFTSEAHLTTLRRIPSSGIHTFISH